MIWKGYYDVILVLVVGVLLMAAGLTGDGTSVARACATFVGGFAIVAGLLIYIFRGPKGEQS